MKHEKRKGKRRQLMDQELAEIDETVGKCVARAGEGVDLKPAPGTDAFTRKLMEEERAFLNPEEWGIDLRSIAGKVLDPPADPDGLSDQEVQGYLRCLVDLMARHHLCLTCTNHLSDRELYRHIMTEVLPKPVGISPNPEGGMVYHECCPCDGDAYLMYYADESTREAWAAEFDLILPERRPLLSDRDTWIELLAEAYRFEPLPQVEEADDEGF